MIYTKPRNFAQSQGHNNLYIKISFIKDLKIKFIAIH